MSRKDARHNLLRALTMLKKAISRLVRRTYRTRSQYPDLFSMIEQAIVRLRAWIQKHRLFAARPAFQVVLGEQMQTLGVGCLKTLFSGIIFCLLFGVWAYAMVSYGLHTGLIREFHPNMLHASK